MAAKVGGGGGSGGPFAPLSEELAALDPSVAAYDALVHTHFELWHNDRLMAANRPDSELTPRFDISQAVMAGQVKHTKLFSDIVPDGTMVKLLFRLKAGNTDAIISAVADVLKDNGIELLDSTAFLAPLLARPGVLTRRQPTADEEADLTFAYGVADAIAGLDIGQTIAIKSTAVVAVEAMEGTDAVIARAVRVMVPAGELEEPRDDVIAGD